MISGRAERRIVAAGLLLSVMSVSQGCISISGGWESASAAAEAYEDRVLDLRQPPTRADLEMPDGQAWTAWSCDEGFRQRVDLPDGMSTTMLARLVTADSYGSADPDTAQPSTIDVHSTVLGVDAAATLAEQVASDLGIDASELETWKVKAETATTTDRVKTSFMRSRIAYLVTELQVVHDPHADSTYVHLILSW